MTNNLIGSRWYKYHILQESATSPSVQAWLLHSGSFMQRLREYGISDAQIHILFNEWHYAEYWENELLNIANATPVIVREVLIHSEKKYWMFARSIFPPSLLTGEESHLMDLQTRPLGSILFNHPEMERSPFSYQCLHEGMHWHQRIMHYLSVACTQQIFKELWARYSVFHLQKKALLLTEVFLPDVFAL